MKLWIYAGLISAAMASSAYAAETTAACEVDDTQRTAQQRVDTSAVFPAPEENRAQRGGGAANATTTVAPLATPRRDVAPTVSTRTDPPRRRNVTRRIPDADLIGGRGAL